MDDASKVTADELAGKIYDFLRKQPDGFATCTAAIAFYVLDSEKIPREQVPDLLGVHSRLKRLCRDGGIFLDTSRHAGKLEGSPQYLDYVVFHDASGSRWAAFDARNGKSSGRITEPPLPNLR